MATAVLTNVPATITDCESITGWSGDTFILDSGVFLQGSNSVSCAMTTNGTNNIQYATTNGPAGEFDATDTHIRLWFYLEFIGNISVEASDGIQVEIISDSGTALYTVAGRDTYDGGFVQAVIDTSATPTSGSAPTTTCTSIGLTVNTDSKPRNVPSNCYIDAIYFGDGYSVTGGTSGDEIDWSHIAALDLIERYGVVTDIDGIYFIGGEVTIGDGATTTWFESGQKVQFKDSSVITAYDPALFGLVFAGSGCRVNITGGAIGAAGTQDYLFDASDAAIVAFDMTGVQFSAANSILFESVADVQNCVFDACGQVVSDNCIFKFNNFANCVATGGAFLWPADDTNVSNLNFSICDNDVEYDSSSDAVGTAFLNIVHDDTGSDFDVNNTSGGAATINLSGTSNANSSTGSAVTFVANTVATLIHIEDPDGNDEIDVQVYMEASSVVSGGLPFEQTINTITRSGITATVTFAADHNLLEDEYLKLHGITDKTEDLSGAFQVAYVSDTVLTYETTDSGSTAYTGTITGTGATIYGQTNGSGNITSSRVYSSPQPLTGFARKSTDAPFYKSISLDDTVSITLGLTINRRLTLDQ